MTSEPSYPPEHDTDPERKRVVSNPPPRPRQAGPTPPETAERWYKPVPAPRPTQRRA